MGEIDRESSARRKERARKKMRAGKDRRTEAENKISRSTKHRTEEKRGMGESSTTRQGGAIEEKVRKAERRKGSTSGEIRRETKKRGADFLEQDRIGHAKQEKPKEKRRSIHPTMETSIRNGETTRGWGTFPEREGRTKEECEKSDGEFYPDDDYGME